MTIKNPGCLSAASFWIRNKSKCNKGKKAPKEQQTSMLYTFHWIIGESKKTPLGNFINALNEKVNDLSDLLEETYATMQKEYHEKEQKIKETYDPLREELNEKYKKLFEKEVEEGLDESTASQFATHYSGLGNLENSELTEDKELFERNTTLSELFFRSILITLYSIVESEVIHTVQSKKLPIKFNYSKKTKELDFVKQVLDNNGIDELRPFYYVSNLRVVRNSIVHNKSMLYPATNDNHKTLVTILKEDATNCTLIPRGDNYEISIKNIQFIRNYIVSTQVLFNQVQWAIDKGDGYEILKSRLIFLLKISDKEVTIDSINVNYQLKETTVDFEGLLPTTQKKSKYKGTLLISNKLDQDAKSMISFTNRIFDSLKSSDAIDFLYNNTLRGFLCKELKQKVSLNLRIES